MDATFFVASSVKQTFKIDNDGELFASHELVKFVPKVTMLYATLHFHHLVKKRISIMNEMIDWSGIRAYASEDTAALTQRL